MLPLVSIIIPVYNARETLHTCFFSLLEQKYENIELCIVDDCSTDDSANFIDSFIRQYFASKMKVIFVRHEYNRGVAAARNTGLDVATGDYICYIDADDKLEAHSIERWVQCALVKDWDIIGCEWFLCFKKNERYMKQATYSTSKEALLNIMKGVMRWNLWLFLVKRELYIKNNIRFIEGMNMGEDLLVMMKLFMCANKVGLLQEGYYHYMQVNDSSLTNTYSKKHILQVTNNINEIEKYAMGTKWEELIITNIPFLKLNIKLPLIITDDTERYEQWKCWWPEVNKFIVKNEKLSLRTKLIQWLAYKDCWYIVKLYYKVIYKFVYGILFR